MKRDPTVLISFLMIAIPVISLILMGSDGQIDRDDPISVQILFWIAFVGAIRAAVLWFQTLSHGLKHAKPENRTALALGHYFLGPLMSYAYYYTSRMNAK